MGRKKDKYGADLYEEYRETNPEELSNEEKRLLGFYLMSQIVVENLTLKDKEFLNSDIEYVCQHCEDTYTIAPAIWNGQCPRCMASQGLTYNSNPFTPVSNAVDSMVGYGCGFLIFCIIAFIFFSLFV